MLTLVNFTYLYYIIEATTLKIIRHNIVCFLFSCLKILYPCFYWQITTEDAVRTWALSLVVWLLIELNAAPGCRPLGLSICFLRGWTLEVQAWGGGLDFILANLSGRTEKQLQHISTSRNHLCCLDGYFPPSTSGPCDDFRTAEVLHFFLDCVKWIIVMNGSGFQWFRKSY